MRMLPMVLAIGVSVIGCGPSERSLSDSERAALSDTIVARMHGYLAAVETLDPERVAPLYVDDADFRVYSDGQGLTRDGLLSLVGSMRSALRSFEGTWDTIEVTLLGRDAALAAAPFHRTLTDTAGSIVHDWGTVTWVWVRRDGEWRLIHGHAVHYPDSLP